MTALSTQLADIFNRGVVALTPLGGGDVADAYRALLEGGTTVFAKTKEHAPPGFFTTEAAGLTWLRDAAAVKVPEVLAVSDDPAFLVLEWIDPGEPHFATEADLGGLSPPSTRQEHRRLAGRIGAARAAADYRTSRVRPGPSSMQPTGSCLWLVSPPTVITSPTKPSAISRRSPECSMSWLARRNHRRGCTVICGPATASSVPGE